MSNDTHYYGWTNYATWRINMEMFDGATLENLCFGNFEDVCGTGKTEELAKNFDTHAIGEHLKNYVCENFDSLALYYALEFVDDVNWYEIAKHLIEAHIDELLV